MDGTHDNSKGTPSADKNNAVFPVRLLGGAELQVLNKLNLYFLFLNSQSKIRRIGAGCHTESVQYIAQC